LSALIECAGAPRDLGLDQAASARAAVRAASARGGVIARWRDRLPGEVEISRWQRDLRRYFPHQHEWLEGVARGSGVPDRALLRAAIAELARGQDALLIGAEGAGRDGAEGEGGTVLWRTESPGVVLRRVRPEGRFVSIELASPLLACPWIGLNEAGLAVAVTGGSQPGRCRAHAALLARDCLERFEAVESALVWCLSRPVAPGASILLADALGEIAGVELHASGRRVRRPEGGVLTLGGPRTAEVRKALSGRATRSLDLERALEEVLGESAVAAAAHVDLASRSLRASRNARAAGP
jgi:hypothetical protein